MFQVFITVCIISIYLLAVYTRPYFAFGAEIFLLIVGIIINIRWIYLKIKGVAK